MAGAPQQFQEPGVDRAAPAPADLGEVSAMTSRAGTVALASAKTTRWGGCVSERVPMRTTAVSFSGMASCLASRPQRWPR